MLGPKGGRLAGRQRGGHQHPVRSGEELGVCVCERDSQAPGGNRTARDRRGLHAPTVCSRPKRWGRFITCREGGGVTRASSGCSLPCPALVVFPLHPDGSLTKLPFFSETCFTRNAAISPKLHQQRNFLCSAHQVSAKLGQPARSSGGDFGKRTESNRF